MAIIAGSLVGEACSARTLLLQNAKLFQPTDERMCCSMRLFLVVGTFYRVQNLVPLVDPRSDLLLASKARRILEIPDYTPILEMQLRREIEFNGHNTETSDAAPGSERPT